jgi:methyl-accepting chemotaxis protein
MTDEGSNVVLRLLREIRAQQETQSATMEAIEGRATAIVRHMEDVKGSVGHALGLSAHANVEYETTGQRLDRMHDEIERLTRRIETLENAR